MKDNLINNVIKTDCFDYLSMLDNESVDAIVTDPPYFIENLKEDLKEQSLRRSSKNNIFHSDWDNSFNDLDTFKKFIERLLKEYDRVLKPKAQVYMFMSYHHLDWIIALIKSMGFRYYKFLIWFKPDTMGVFPNQYGCNYEVILWFRKTGDDGRVKLNIGNGQRDVFTINSTNIKVRKEADFHPTVKPLKLIKQLILNCTDKNDVVLDTFMGSGTTAVACKETSRFFIGCEREENYHLTILQRLKYAVFNGLERQGKLI